jgi:pimeloyl-ACP methyl ester carboxylesterase
MMIIVGVVLGIALLTVLYIAICWAPERQFEDLQPRWGLGPSAFVEVDGMRVHLRDEGPRHDPSPLVLLHGTVSSLHTWEGWAEDLKRDKRVIRLDLPGFGLTGPSAHRRYGAEHDVEFVIALLDCLNIERCVLGGNSLGGGISWRTALLHPLRVEKLILVDAEGYSTRAISKPIAFYFTGLPMVPWMVRNTFPGAIVEQGLRNVYGNPGKVGAELVMRTRELTQLRGNREALIERGRQWLRPPKLTHRIAELKLPTLIIWGGRDRLIPPENARRFHRDIAASTMVIFDELGHMPQEEDPVRTVAVVREFLQLTAGPSASSDECNRQ